MKKLFTFFFALIAVFTVSAQKTTTLFEDSNAPMLSWSAVCNVTAAQVDGIQAGDQFVVTVNARQEGNEWPKFGFEMGSESIYPSAFEMWGDDKSFPCEVTYTVSAADAELLANGFEIKGDGVQITKVVFVQNEPEETPSGDKVLFNDPNAPMLSWSAVCNVTAAQVDGIQAGDQFVVTVNARQEGNDWPKFGFEMGSESIYPSAFEMWGDDKSFPCEVTYTVSAADAELLANGFEIKGDGVQITKVVFVQNEPEETPSGEKVLFNDPNAPMLSWSAVCNVTAAQVEGIQAGDQFVVTVNARQEGNDWPKFGFEMGSESIYPSAFEMWGDDKSFPCEVTYTVSAADAELLANGFEIKGDGVQITKVVFVQKNGEVDPADNILWTGEPTLLTWSQGPTVSADKAANIEVGNAIAITITEVVSGDGNWPKVVCRSSSDYNEIFDIQLYGDEYADAVYPMVKEVTVTESMLPMLKGGFHFVGESTYISEVALDKNPDITTVNAAIEAGDPGIVSVYTITGICVRRHVEADAATADLPAGLYIVGGKKVLVK